MESEKRIEAKLDQLQDSIVKSAENLTARFQAEIDKQISEVEGKIRTVNGTLSENVEAVRNESNQNFGIVHDKINSLCEEVVECISVQAAENKTSQDRLASHSEVRTKEMISKEVTVLQKERNSVYEKVESLSKGSSDKMGELVARIDRLQDQVVEGISHQTESSTSVQSHVGITVGHVDNETRASNVDTDTNVTSECVGVQSVCGRDLHVDESGLVRQMHDRAGCGNIQWYGGILNDVSLPKLTDSSKQHVVEYLNNLRKYFELKAVPESMKLPLAIKSVTERYASQWITSVSEDIKDFNHRVMSFIPTKSIACISTSWILGNVYTAKSCMGKKRDPDALKLGLVS
jgi:hypothetical protein